MKIIIFDDDPTGSQTVHDCPLLLNWDKKTILQGLNSSSPLLFILTDTRRLSALGVENRLKKITSSIKEVSMLNNINVDEYLFISRGDSTLRGHGYLEPKIINEEFGPFDATFHIPAFIEGARITVDGTHLLDSIPVHLTDFAKDKIFGYSTSFLPEWLEEKSLGEISAENLELINYKLLNYASKKIDGMRELCNFILHLKNNTHVIVDASSYLHLNVFANAIREVKKNKKLLFRTSASFISALSALPENKDIKYKLNNIINKNGKVRPSNGLILIGSYVKLSSHQLDELMTEKNIYGVEFNVSDTLELYNNLNLELLFLEIQKRYIMQLTEIINDSKTPVLFSTRKELIFENDNDKREKSLIIALCMSHLASKLIPHIGYVISKGGTTTQTFLKNGLGQRLVNLQGQILPGLSVITPEQENISNMPIVTFPGNLGDKYTLLKAWRLIELIIKNNNK
mgnify:CR=1 FL=1